MKESNTKTKDKITWRRNKVLELSVKGFQQAEIARMLQISEPTISRDIEYLRERANETIRNHIQKKLPYEYTKCISGLEEIIKESWIVATEAEKNRNTKDKLQSLALIKDTYNTKMDLLTNASLLQDSIKFVEDNKDKVTLRSNERKVEKKVLGNGIQGSTEDNITEQYNEVF
jgi:transcriptional regulator